MPGEIQQPPVQGGKKVSDHLANERTVLAWIRTSLAIIGLGFVIDRFGLFLRTQAPGALPSTPLHYSTALGVALVGVGMLTLIFACISFLRVRKAIISDEVFQASPSLPLLLISLLAILALCLFVYLWLVS